MSHWKMDALCDNCPFAKDGQGRHLRRTLGRGRWAEILSGLRGGAVFNCHKTTDETGNGTNLICAGAMRWQHIHGLTSNLERVMERLDWIAARRAEPRVSGGSGGGEK